MAVEYACMRIGSSTILNDMLCITTRCYVWQKKNNGVVFIVTSKPLKLTTIAIDTVLKGTIEVEGSLRVDGMIEGDITCHNTVVICPQKKSHGKGEFLLGRTARHAGG